MGTTKHIITKVTVLAALAVLFVAFLPLRTSSAPIISITSPASGASGLDSSFTVTGTATANSTVKVSVDGVQVGQATSDGSGNWSVSVVGQTTGPKNITATVLGPIWGFSGDSQNPGEVSGFNATTNQYIGTDSNSTSTLTIAGAITPQGKVYSNRFCLSCTLPNTIDVFDSTTATLLTTTTPVAVYPQSLTSSANGDYVYITYAGSADYIALLDTSTNTVSSTISVSNDPTYVDLSNDGSKLYVLHDEGAVSVISTETNTVVNTFSTNVSGAGLNLLSIDLSPDDSVLYVGNTSSGNLEAFNATTGALISSTVAPVFPAIIKATEDYVYFGNFLGGSQTALGTMNTQTNATTTKDTSGDAYNILGLSYNQSNGKLYIAGQNTSTGAGEIRTYDAATDTLEVQITGWPSSSQALLVSVEFLSRTEAVSTSVDVTVGGLAGTGIPVNIAIISAGIVLTLGFASRHMVIKPKLYL